MLLSTITDASAENVMLPMVSGASVGNWLIFLAALTVGVGAGPTVPNASMISEPRPGVGVLVLRVATVPLASMEDRAPDKSEDPWVTTSWLRVGLGSQDVLEATTIPEADRIRLTRVPDLVTAEPGARV